MARCTKRRVRNGKLVQILLTDHNPPLQQNWTALDMVWAMFSISLSLALCKPITGRSRRFREQWAVNNIAEDIVWMEAQNPFYAPIFQNSFNVLTNISHKYKCKYKYKCSVLGFLLLTYYSGKVISGVHCEQMFEMSRPKLVSGATSHSPVHNMLKIFLLFTF